MILLELHVLSMIFFLIITSYSKNSLEFKCFIIGTLIHLIISINLVWRWGTLALWPPLPPGSSPGPATRDCTQFAMTMDHKLLEYGLVFCALVVGLRP